MTYFGSRSDRPVRPTDRSTAARRFPDGRGRPCPVRAGGCPGRRRRSRSAGPASVARLPGHVLAVTSDKTDQRHETRDTRHETEVLVSRVSCLVSRVCVVTAGPPASVRVQGAKEPIDLLDIEERVAGLDAQEKQVAAGRANRGTWKRGDMASAGRCGRACRTRPVKAALRIVHSNVTGIDAGHECNGRPPMLSGYVYTAV